MTPAIKFAERKGIDFQIHHYQHDANSTSYGLEAAQKLNQNQNQVFKTLVLKLDNGRLTVAITPVNTKVSLKRVAKAAGVKKALMASSLEVERSTGYVLGGVSPLGQKTPLLTIIHRSALSYERIYVSAGRRGLELEIAPQDLVKLTRAKIADIEQS